MVKGGFRVMDSDSAYPRAIETFLELEGVSEVSKRKILWDNCARLYSLQ